MLQELMKKLCEEWELPESGLAAQEPGCYVIPLENDIKIVVSPTPKGYMMKCSLAPYPTAKGEAFATDTMLANLFGQGTQGAILGLTADGNTLTLTQVVEHGVDAKEFRETLEDFITSIDVWRDEALKK